MKKNFWKLFIIFGVLLCIFAFYGCEEAETTLQSSETTSAEATESTSETDEITEKVKETTSAAEITSEAEETSAETTETEVQTLETSEFEETSAQTEETTAETEVTSSETESFTESVETTEEITDNDETLEESFILDEELVLELEYYLKNIYAEYDLIDVSFSDKIDEIKSGEQALFLKFDPDDCYYVCGYYSNDELDHSEFDSKCYCSVEEYTWIGFNDEKKITDKYEDKDFVVAFQFNRTEINFDLVPSNRLVPDVDHFDLFTPDFENGVNVAEGFVYDATYVYINSSNKNTVYYYYDGYHEDLHNNATIPGIVLEDQCFIIQRIYPVDDSETDFILGNSLGEYYDSLMDIMMPGKYSQEDDLGRIRYYGLFEIEAFVNAIFKN